MIGKILSKLVEPIMGVVSEVVTDKDERNRIEALLKKAALDQTTTLALAARDVIVAEANGASWMQRNWRPLTMLSFVAIIVNNYLVLPYIDAAVVLEIPPGMWNMLTIGLGGYVVGRTFEKTGSSINIGGKK